MSKGPRTKSSEATSCTVKSTFVTLGLAAKNPGKSALIGCSHLGPDIVRTLTGPGVMAVLVGVGDVAVVVVVAVVVLTAVVVDVTTLVVTPDG